jgi:uncharacterized membrane protein YbaN (DUF454 family)
MSEPLRAASCAGDVERQANPLLERPWARSLIFIAGWLFFGIGAVGIVLPGLPGTVFLILAAACFTRSSPRFEAWLLDHPRFGPPVRRWRETGAIPRPVKWFAGLSLAASWLMILATSPLPVAIGCAVLFAGVAIFITTRPEA